MLWHQAFISVSGILNSLISSESFPGQFATQHGKMLIRFFLNRTFQSIIMFYTKELLETKILLHFCQDFEVILNAILINTTLTNSELLVNEKSALLNVTNDKELEENLNLSYNFVFTKNG